MLRFRQISCSLSAEVQSGESTTLHVQGLRMPADTLLAAPCLKMPATAVVASVQLRLALGRLMPWCNPAVPSRCPVQDILVALSRCPGHGSLALASRRLAQDSLGVTSRHLGQDSLALASKCHGRDPSVVASRTGRIRELHHSRVPGATPAPDPLQVCSSPLQTCLSQ